MCALQLIRIDFVPEDTICQSGCTRKIEMAHVILNNNGKELFYGSSCIHKIFSSSELKKLKLITPNLTIHTEKPPVSIGNSSFEVNNETFDNSLKYASEYLWLRLDKMIKLNPGRAGFLLWRPLVEKFDILKRGGKISKSDIIMILNTERRASIELRRTNLIDVYSAMCQLQNKMKQNPSEYLDGILLYLKTNLRLTKMQIKKAGLNLPKTAFNWYVPKLKE